MSPLLRLWIVAWLCSASLGKNLPLNGAESAPPPAGGSEFDKALAVVNAMFQQIGRTEDTPQPTEGPSAWGTSDPGKRASEHPSKDAAQQSRDTRPLHDDHVSKYIDSFFAEAGDLHLNDEADVRPPNTNTDLNDQYFAKIKDSDSDFIMIDPLRKDDNNAATVSKLVSGPRHPRMRSPSPKLRARGTMYDRGPGPEDENHEGNEDEAPVRQSRGKDADEEDDEDEEESPVEGAPVVESDMDDLAPETFKPPTVLGVGRHYKVGSAFSVFPVHIPNSPEHLDLGAGVPADSVEDDEDDREGDREDEDSMEKELEAGAEALADAVDGADADAQAEVEADAEAEDENEHDADADGELGKDADSEEMEPHSTMSSDKVVNLELPSGETADLTEDAASKKGPAVSGASEDVDAQHQEKDKGHEAAAGDHDEVHHAEKATSLKEGSEKSKSFQAEDSGKKAEGIKEGHAEGQHQDSGGGHKEDAVDGGEDYGRSQVTKGYHDKYNFDKRSSRNRFYQNRRKSGDWANSGEGEESGFKETEGEEKGSHGKYEERSENGRLGAEEKEGDGGTKEVATSKVENADGTEGTASDLAEGSESSSGKTVSSSTE